MRSRFLMILISAVAARTRWGDPGLQGVSTTDGLSNILSAARAAEREAVRSGKTLNPVDTRGEER